MAFTWKSWSRVCFPGSQDSEVSEEQKKEKIMELKKKEKLLQEKLLQKVEELKKICLREAVRAAPPSGVGQVGALFSHWALPGSLCVFPRSWQARCPRSIPWVLGRSLPRWGGALARRSSWMTTCSPVRRWAWQLVWQQAWGGQSSGQSHLQIIQLFPGFFKRKAAGAVACVEWEILVGSALLSAMPWTDQKNCLFLKALSWPDLIWPWLHEF